MLLCAYYTHTLHACCCVCVSLCIKSAVAHVYLSVYFGLSMCELWQLRAWLVCSSVVRMPPLKIKERNTGTERDVDMIQLTVYSNRQFQLYRDRESEERKKQLMFHMESWVAPKGLWQKNTKQSCGRIFFVAFTLTWTVYVSNMYDIVLDFSLFHTGTFQLQQVTKWTNQSILLLAKHFLFIFFIFIFKYSKKQWIWAFVK